LKISSHRQSAWPRFIDGECTLLRIRFAALALVCALASIVACTTAGEQTPAQLTYCTQLYSLWARYHFNLLYHHDGQRVQAELAMYDCKRGNLDAGTKELQRLLRRDLIPFPPG
jgi:cobalamin biosynthesis protein CobD/CbiB